MLLLELSKGSGQGFTRRALIEAMIRVMTPEPGITICDPAAGKGGIGFIEQLGGGDGRMPPSWHRCQALIPFWYSEQPRSVTMLIAPGEM